jgi:hypothetical protein
MQKPHWQIILTTINYSIIIIIIIIISAKRKSDDKEEHMEEGTGGYVEEMDGGKWQVVSSKKRQPKKKEDTNVGGHVTHDTPNNAEKIQPMNARPTTNNAESNKTKTVNKRTGVLKKTNETHVRNPYLPQRDVPKQKVQINEENERQEEQSGSGNVRQGGNRVASSLQRTITSYASATKVTNNAHQIRFNFSFNVRVNSISEWRRVARILLEQCYEIDSKAFILPWNENKIEGSQGMTLEMVTNKLTMRDSMIARYFNANGNMIPGKVYYQAGVRISTELEKRMLIDCWKSRKRDRKERGLDVINIGVAYMQNSEESFVIGIAVGSSEDQDTTILN